MSTPRLRCALLCALCLLLPALPTLAQDPPAAAPPMADSADVASVDAILAALYDVISGPANQPRDWDRFRALLLPEARLVPLGRRQEDGAVVAHVFSVEDYIERAAPYFEQNGFFEIETARTTERYGNLVHAFSTYESRQAAEDPEPFARGINSIQFIYKEGRWWIVNIAWQPEWDDLHIPAAYLPREP